MASCAFSVSLFMFIAMGGPPEVSAVGSGVERPAERPDLIDQPERDLHACGVEPEVLAEATDRPQPGQLGIAEERLSALDTGWLDKADADVPAHARRWQTRESCGGLEFVDRRSGGSVVHRLTAPSVVSAPD